MTALGARMSVPKPETDTRASALDEHAPGIAPARVLGVGSFRWNGTTADEY